MAGDTEKRITAKMVLDSSGFNSSLKGVNSQLKNAQSQMKLASSGIQAFGKDSEKLKSVQEALSRQVELHSKKVDIYSKSIEKTKSKLEDNIKVRDKLKQSLDSANKKYDEAVKTYGKESEQAKKAKDEVDKLTQEHKKAEKAVESNAKKIQNYDTNLNKAQSQMNKAQGELNKLNKELEQGSNKWLVNGQKLKESGEKFKTVGGHVDTVGNKMLKLTAPIAAVGIASAKVSMDFDSQMSRVKAISGATGQEFNKLRDSALDLGAKTSYSAKEVAFAQENMASAGFKTNEILKSTPGVLDMAASSGIELADASAIAATSIRGFGLDASQTGHVADVLAKSAADTNADVMLLGNAFKYVAPIAKVTGFSLEEMTSAIGMMADAGIDGSTAGTTLRGAITRLAKPSEASAMAMERIGFTAFDANGKFKSLAAISEELKQKTSKLTDEQRQNTLATIFGQEALSGMTVLMDAGGKKINDTANSLKKCDGNAKKMADTMKGNTKGSIEEMMGSLETAGIKIGTALAPSITKAAKVVGDLADRFSKLSPETQNNIIKFGAMAIATAGITKGIGSLLIGVGNTKVALGALGLKIGATATTTATAGATMATTGAKAGLLTKAVTGIKGAGALASSGITGLAGALGISVPVLGAVAVGAVAVGAGAYKLHQHMKKEAVPSVDLFDKKLKITQTTMDKYGNKITTTSTKTVNFTNQTKKAVGQFVKDSDKVSKTVFNLCATQTKITAKTAKDVTQQYINMGNKIKQAEDVKYKQRLVSFKQFLANNNTMSAADKAKALQKMQESHNKQQQQTDAYTKRITQILDNARKNNGKITDQERQEINSIQEKMKVEGIKKLSTSEQESKVILSRLKSYGTRITAEQASEVIKNAEKQRSGSVNKANQQYSQTVAQIKKMRDEDHSITKDQATKMIAEAERQKKGSIEKAEQHKSGVVKQIQKMNSDTLKDIDTTDGSILTKWEKLKNWFANNPIIRWIKSKTSGDPEPQKKWTGDRYFSGGLTYLHDAPGRNSNYELYDLPRGTRIFNHDASADLVMKTAENVATKVANSVLSGFNGTNGINVTQHIYSPKPSASEIARQSKNNLRELALQW